MGCQECVFVLSCVCWLLYNQLVGFRTLSTSFRKLKKNNNQSLMDLYKLFRNRVSASLNESKARYFYNYFQQNSKNMKQLWSGIKSVVSVKKSSNLNVIKKWKDSNGNITSDPVVIASIFNKFFVNVSHDITKNIPRSNKSLVDFMGDRVRNSFLPHPQFPLKYLI